MGGMGYAMMGTATAEGENACAEAAKKAISSPLMESGGVRGARGILINITASSHLGLHEVNDACTLIANATENDDVQINFGVVLDESMGDDVKITVIATGFVRENLPRIERRTTRTISVPSREVSYAAEPAAEVEPAVRTEFPAQRIELKEEPRYEMEPALAEALSEEPLPEEMPSAMAASINGSVTHNQAAGGQAANASSSQAASGQAAGGQVNGHADNLFDDVEVPAILRRNRRLIQ
jgi:cell division protein FtsZ